MTRAGRPSFMARWVAAQRGRLAGTRPSTPAGDTDSEQRLYADVAGGFSIPLGRPAAMAERTQAVDAEVARALGHGTRQVVLLGAGYDGRPLRFGGAQTLWFEVDLPVTLADKRSRLHSLGIEPAGVRFVNADLLHGDVAAALDAAGHDPAGPSLFVCEGLLATLTLEAAARLCSTLRTRAPHGSVLVVSVVVTPEGEGLWRAWRGLTDLVLRAPGERRRSDYAPGDPEKLMAVTGWRVVHTVPGGPAPSARPKEHRRPRELVLVCEPGS